MQMRKLNISRMLRWVGVPLWCAVFIVGFCACDDDSPRQDATAPDLAEDGELLTDGDDELDVPDAELSDAELSDTDIEDVELSDEVELDTLPDWPDLEQEACVERSALRQVFFGDLHLHTAFSFDAWAYGLRLSPDDAYRFAKGERVNIAPLDENGEGTRSVQLRRPLDFAMVSDHSEFFGETAQCTEPEAAAYGHPNCQMLREGSSGVTLFGLQFSLNSPRMPICPSSQRDCVSQSAAKVWQEIQDAAHRHQDFSSACSFTTFVGFEYTNTKQISNQHRNVIFRNERVPARPISYYGARSA
ncbi:MAG: DUF3604 domain-containing protein, partial [Myxococcota bacterium]|nr:DUF3604 domain-containing protein [Myxococcota bacterium]